MSVQTTLQTALSTEVDKLLGCIHCGLCLPSCPTYMQLGNENDSPRGRIYLMRAVSEGRLDVKSHSFSRHIDLCLGCRACETACPAGVRYGFLLESARETINEHGSSVKGPAAFQKKMLGLVLKRVFPYPNRLKTAFRLIKFFRDNPITRFIYSTGLIHKISSNSDFALSLLMTTAGGINGSKSRKKNNIGSKKGDRPVTVFAGCIMDGLYNHTNEATARVLAVNDCEIKDVPGQGCCGALHAHSGDLTTARKLARRNIDVFDQFISPQATEPATIIINAAGCGSMLKEYGELLADDPEYASRAESFSHSVRDVTEFLAHGEVKQGAPLDMSVTYDAPCHLYHAQRVTGAPQKLLSGIPGIKYSQLEGMQDCCGGAGIYNMTEPEMSERLLSDKIGKVKQTGAELLLTANPGCHMQLGAGIRKFSAECRVAHIIELLDESYRRAGFYS